MDPNLMHRNGMDAMDLNHFQGDATKLNPGVLRGIDGSTLHFISIPRTTENEYMDHALLSPEYITAHIQNGLVVDIIQPHDQHASIPSHNIYNSSEPIEHNTPPMEMTSDRHFLSNSENVTIPISNIHQSMQSNHSSIPSNHLSHRSHFESSANIESNRKIIIGDQPRQYILTNEAPVIVSNKEASISMNDLDLSNSFPNTFSPIDETVLQDMNKGNSGRLSNSLDLQSKIQTNVLPPMPPLTPIPKIQAMRKSPIIEPPQHQTIQYKSAAHTSALINLPKSGSMLKSCFIPDDDDVGFIHSSLKMGRQTSKEQTIAPRKSLPHKKRITKKLKSISPSIDHMQSSDAEYQSEMIHLSHDQPYSISNQQNETLNLTLNHPIQLTTTRVEHQAPNETDYIPSDYNASESAIQMHPLSSNIAESQSSRFTCDICGMQYQTQLGFFNHLKLHYEPEPPVICKIESVRATRSIASSMEATAQRIYHDERKLNANQCISNQSMNAPVIMNENYVRLQNHEPDFGCMSAIGTEDVTDDESINDYNDTGINHIKSEQNEFSDAEDMLENGVLDKVQRVVDSYIENGTSEVKNLIDLSENQHHAGLVGNPWSPNNSHAMPSNGHMNSNHFVITPNSQIKETQQSTETQVISSQRPEELTLIYELNVNDKDFPIMDDTSSETILRRQLARADTGVITPNHSQYDHVAASTSKTADSSIQQEISSFEADAAESATTKINIQDEFIEEEQTDSDVDPEKPEAQKKKKKIYRCKRCNKLCNSKNALHYHFLSHTGERPHQCNECGKSFFASSALKVHKRLHSGDKPYNCEFCNRPFRQWGDLKYHIQSKHTKEKSHQCEFCGKDFARRYSLVIHRRIHTGEKNYKCEFCDKEFRASSYLQVHRKIHTGEKPFVCDVCGKRFRVRGDLKRHSNIHERNKAKDVKIEDLSCMSNGSSSEKNEMFIIDDNNTLQSRSADTLDQLVSVIESTDSALTNDSANDSLKRRNFMQVSYEKSFKTKHKRDWKAVEDGAPAILNYSSNNLMDKSLPYGNEHDNGSAMEKIRDRHQ